MVASPVEKSRRFDEMDSFGVLEPGADLIVSHFIRHIEGRENLLQHGAEWVWDADPVHHLDGANISVAGAFYGEALNSPEEIIAATRKTMAGLGVTEVDDYTSKTGFPILRQMSTGLEDTDYQLSEELAANELITTVLERQGIFPEDVDLFIATTSIPIAPSFGKDWAAAGGLPEGVPVIRICEACNSSGHAIERVLSGDFDALIGEYNPKFKQGKRANIVLFSLDDANRFADRGGDSLSPQFFSTGAVAMAWEYHPTEPSSMKLIVHKSRSVENGTQYLLVPRPYDDWSANDREGLYVAEYLKEPDHEGPVTMHPRSSILFRKYATELAQDVMAEYAQQGGSPADIKRVIIHQPSKSVFDSVQNEMIEVGFTAEQIHWVINEGNVPVATIPIAFGRQLEDLAPGDRVMFLSFGAGGEYTCFIADIGNTEAVH